MVTQKLSIDGACVCVTLIGCLVLFLSGMHVEPENPSVTPTVELNALAMKRGESASYHPIERPRPVYYPMSTYNFRGIYNQR